MTGEPGPGFRCTTETRVRYAETDPMGFAYHAHYLVWCDMGRTDFIRRLGRSYAELERSGLLLAVTDARVRYHAAARYDDVLSIETRLDRVQTRGVTFGYDIARLNAPPGRLATAAVTLIALDRNGKPRRLPPELLRLFREVLAPPV